jgi:RNA polymerase sigma-70 factor (ECF subfamily)
MTTLPRAQHFLRHASLKADALAGLEGALDECLQRARHAWPGVSLDDDVFIEHLGRRFGNPEDPASHFTLWHVEDLYLACACAKGDPAALELFDAYVMVSVAPALKRWNPTFHHVEDVEQLLRQKLLMAQGDKGPKIADYSGKGPLTKWLRASAIRTAVSLTRGEKPVTSINEDDAIADWSTPLSDPELDFIKQQYRGEFSVCFKRALATLSAQDRNVLRLHLLDGLNIEQIGNLYGTHRSTVARWIAKSRQTLLEGTKREMGDKLQVNRNELESLMLLLRSQLDLSINRFLQRDHP